MHRPRRIGGRQTTDASHVGVPLCHGLVARAQRTEKLVGRWMHRMLSLSSPPLPTHLGIMYEPGGRGGAGDTCVRATSETTYRANSSHELTTYDRRVYADPGTHYGDALHFSVTRDRYTLGVVLTIVP